MNYNLAYNRFCAAKRKQNIADGLLKSKTDVMKRGLTNGLQIHHIKPKRFNGPNNLSNFVLLSREDHVFAHLLLDLAMYQQHGCKMVKKLNYGVYRLPKKFLKKHALKNLKIELQLSRNENFIEMTLAQAAFYYAGVKHKDATNRGLLVDCAWEVLRRCLTNSQKYDINFRLKLPRS